MADFFISQFQPQLHAEAERFGLDAGTVCIVPCIRDYCASLGKPELEDNESRVGLWLSLTDDKPLFVLRDHITPSLHIRAVVPLVIRGFPKTQKERLNDPLTFARHLLLHEMAHYLRRELHREMDLNAVERDCDEWAFANL